MFGPTRSACSTMLGRLLLSRGSRSGLAAALCPRRPLCVAPPSLEHVSAALGLSESDERHRRLHLLMLEYTEMQISGARVPDAVSVDDWSELMRLDSISRRRKYFGYLFKKEKAQQSDRAKRVQRAAERQEQLARQPPPPPSGHLRYGLGHNTIFHRIGEGTMKAWEEQRLYTAMQFGQPLVMDMSFEPNMTRRENKNTAQQMCHLFSYNRAALDPFDLHLCNLSPNGEVMEFLRRFVPTIEEPAFPMHLHEANYLDLYPRERLVYLTPHCRYEVQEFDHDAVYIVGGLVDLVNGRPLSLAKAKKEGIKMAKLPLQKYLRVGPSFNTSLTLTAMIQILLELKASGSWERALQHVPRRGLLTPEQQQAQAEKDQRLVAAAERSRQRWREVTRAAVRDMETEKNSRGWAGQPGRDRTTQATDWNRTYQADNRERAVRATDGNRTHQADNRERTTRATDENRTVQTDGKSRTAQAAGGKWSPRNER